MVRYFAVLLFGNYEMVRALATVATGALVVVTVARCVSIARQVGSHIVTVRNLLSKPVAKRTQFSVR
jgi:hypothetical protein